LIDLCPAVIQSGRVRPVISRRLIGEGGLNAAGTNIGGQGTSLPAESVSYYPRFFTSFSSSSFQSGARQQSMRIFMTAFATDLY